MSSPEHPPDSSSDATWSTYSPAPDDKAAEFPPPGPSTLQVRGTPAAAKTTKAAKASTSGGSA